MTTMDFFGHQERARRASKGLLVWFGLAVLGIVACVYLAAAATLQVVDRHGGGMWRGDVFLVVAGGTMALIFLASMFKVAQLRSGGKKVAELLGGRPIDLQTKDEKERMFRNIVEEMAIASGTPVPAIYVLDDERAINAFAAGWSPADAVIAVTRGSLEQLDRDELQGVVAHEFSHVFHGDMRLNIRIMGVLFGIVCIATVGRVIVRAVGRGGGGNKKGGAAGLVLFGLALLLIGGLGVLFARLIQAAVSRQREFLADASAVQYTRNPRGIGMALAKIGGLGSRLQSPQTESASHMLFADGLRHFLGNSMATHPPIEQRVERILPGFTRNLAGADSMLAAAAATPAPRVAGGAAALVAAAAPIGARVGHTLGGGRVSGRAVVESAGDVRPEQVDAARALLREIPLDLSAAARDPLRARALVLALLLPRDAAARREVLAQALADAPDLVHEATVAKDALTHCGRHLHLPLVSLAIATLRALRGPEIATLRQQARRLAMADGVLSPFEFALLRMLERHLRLPGELPLRPPGRPESLLQHGEAVAVLLSALARVGTNDEAGARAAFARGAAALGAGIPVQMSPRRSGAIAELDAAVTTLHRVSPLGKRNLLLACAEIAGADGNLDAEEADLLRALAELWDCPIPLVLGPDGQVLRTVTD